MIEITKSEIETSRVLESVSDPSAGGINIFIGTTRNHARDKKVLSLEYEAYEPMALSKMQEIERDARKQWDVKHISIVHRVGNVEIGKASVVIAVSSIHRKEAFEACKYLIDTLKKVVPIWKKEVFENGEIWVDSRDTMV